MTFTDKGKPCENLGRKTIGPYFFLEVGSQFPKGEIDMFKNLKNNLFAVIVLLFVFLLVPASVIKAEETIQNIDLSQLSKGIIIINYIPEKDVKTKVMIAKEEIKYTYDIQAGNAYPLQSGDGTYTVTILENIKDNAYRIIEKEDVVLVLTNENDVFLQSIQNVNWNSDMSIIKKSKKLTSKAKTDKEKAEIIYKYIVKNIKYDYKKAKEVKDDYLPSIEDTVKELKGICYDYAALYAAMLRSVNVPTRLVMGYNKDNKDEYHAWNQVYLKETKEWVTVDTTYDASYYSNVPNKKFIRNSKDYTATGVY